MYGELNEASRARVDRKEFEAAYREAEQMATARTLDAGSAGDADRDATPARSSRSRSTVEHRRLRRRSKPSSSCPSPTAAIEWDPSLVFPGLTQGEELAADVELRRTGADPRPRRDAAGRRARPKNANTRSAAPRSTSPAKSAKPPKKNWPALARHGFPPETPVGISGLERAFNARLAGKPGGSLLAVADRRLRGPHPRRSRSRSRARR